MQDDCSCQEEDAGYWVAAVSMDIAGMESVQIDMVRLDLAHLGAEDSFAMISEHHYVPWVPAVVVALDTAGGIVAGPTLDLMTEMLAEPSVNTG